MSAQRQLRLDEARPRRRGLDEATIGSILELAASEQRFAAFEAAGRSCSWCAEPVRLAGTARRIDASTGEVLSTTTSTYYKACGTRRATRCPSCAERYRRDARTIVLTGLQGGRGIPGDVAGRPIVFATFTAPSFGPVHRARRRGERALPCRPGADKRCRHGRRLVCNAVHRNEDRYVGEPLCPDCYDYDRAVVWNALAPELWRRTTIYARRHLARLAETSEKALRERCRLSFVKVVEYQRRGVVHLHVLARLDPLAGAELPSGCDVGGLAQALLQAVQQVRVPYPGGLGGMARFGVQADVQRVGAEGSVAGVAGYLAKYATKGSDEHGGLDRRLRSSADLDRRELPEHVRRLARAAWRLGGRTELAGLGLRRFAHALGFRGHWLTKSRGWSVTFAALRAERAAWRAGGDEELGAAVVELRSWAYEARGWASDGEAALAGRRERDAAGTRRDRAAVQDRSPGMAS